MTNFYEIKGDSDGDFTEGLIVCPPCARKSTAEGYHVTAEVVSPAVCCSCGVTNAVPPYETRKELREATLAVGRDAS